MDGAADRWRKFHRAHTSNLLSQLRKLVWSFEILCGHVPELVFREYRERLTNSLEQLILSKMNGKNPLIGKHIPRLEDTHCSSRCASLKKMNLVYGKQNRIINRSKKTFIFPFSAFNQSFHCFRRSRVIGSRSGNEITSSNQFDRIHSTVHEHRAGGVGGGGLNRNIRKRIETLGVALVRAWDN